MIRTSVFGIACLILSMSLAACGSSSEGFSANADVEASADGGASQDLGSQSNDVLSDVNTEDPTGDSSVSTNPDAGTGTEKSDAKDPEGDPACVGEGCPGDLCKADLDCQSLRCVLHFGEKVCASPCKSDADCPEFWTCDLGAEGSDKFCRSEMPHLCLPCRGDSECLSNSGTDFCVSYGNEGAFCSGNCADGGACPTGYSCVERTSLDGVTAPLCVRDAGICECSTLASDLGRITDCVQDSVSGGCDGFRKCTPLGLTKCTGDAAGVEECNLVDDDCDGQLDESTCDDGDPCTMDFCNDSGSCQNDPQQLDGLCEDPDDVGGGDPDPDDPDPDDPDPDDPDPDDGDPTEETPDAFVGCTGSATPTEIPVSQGTKTFAVGGLLVKSIISGGTTKVSFKLWGAGGGGCFPGSGGGGGFVNATFAVKQGDAVEMRVGTGGVAYGAGGGATYALINGETVAVAAGGGGAGCDGCSGCVGTIEIDGAGGAGGAPGGAGQSGNGLGKYGIVVVGAGGGTQTQGGAVGTITDGSVYGGCVTEGLVGEADRGADGHAGPNCSAVSNGAVAHCGGEYGAGNGGGGGGGSGHFGGGSGSSKYTYVASGGGGGSSWVRSDALSSGGAAGNLATPGGTGDPDYSDMSGQGGKSGDGTVWPGGDWKPKDGHAGRAVWSFD